jgi:hypothetical protein
MNGKQRNATNAQIWGKKTTRITMATVPHVTSGLGIRKFLTDGFLLSYIEKYADSGTRTNVVRFRSPDWDTQGNMPIAGFEPT